MANLPNDEFVRVMSRRHIVNITDIRDWNDLSGSAGQRVVYWRCFELQASSESVVQAPSLTHRNYTQVTLCDTHGYRDAYWMTMTHINLWEFISLFCLLTD